MPKKASMTPPTCTFRKKFDITIVNGEPYYRKREQKDGKRHHSTWLYFQGITRKKEPGHDKKNAQEHYRFFPVTGKMLVQKEELKERMGQLVMIHIGTANLASEFNFRRFVDLPKMCISCALGGGFWETRKGKKFGSFLKANYANYFNSIPGLKNAVTDQYNEGYFTGIDSPRELNQWLKQHCSREVAIGRTHLYSIIQVEDTFDVTYESPYSSCTLL